MGISAYHREHRGWPWATLLATLLAVATNVTVASKVIAADTPTGQPLTFLSNFASVDLMDQRGDAFDAADLSNHVVLVNFIFTGCDSTCPIQTRALSQVLDDLPAAVRPQVRFVSISLDPGNDTPAKLQQFARTLNADKAGWLFLTGDVIALQDIARRLHMLDEAAPNTPRIHRTSLWLVDKQGRMLQRYKGNPPDQQRLVRELTQVANLPLAAR